MLKSINYTMQSLCEVQTNKDFEIIKIDGAQTPITRRLLELGFLPGRKIRVAKKSLSRKTVLVEISGYLLALRCTVAQAIFVE